MKVKLILDGHIPATATVVAELPDDITEAELNASNHYKWRFMHVC